MSAKISNTATGAVQAIIESSEERDMSKYTLKGVNFEAAANGVIAKLRFEMKPEEQDKLRKKSKGNYVDYDTRCFETPMVFEGFDSTKVGDLLMTALKDMKESKGDAAEEDEDGE
jgi:hypothetical protein